ncbi:MAG: cytochrome c5 family protein [Pseudomonadales bacterium]|nr:cytochrome c5 family protein [Pseudomonadales bacterium]MCP5216310.1 cytochrome c5 family protein [Pseudomonadales bacterium]
MKILCAWILAVSFTLTASAQELGKTFQKTCGFCHQSGVAGAPKIGDRAAWEPRLKKGMKVLVESVVSGKGAMPPKGLCANCGTEDYRALINYMAAQ